MKETLNRAWQKLSHSFDTRLVGERELEQATLLGDSVARYPHYKITDNRREGFTRNASKLYF